MKLKIIIISLLFVNSLFAKYEKISVGHIDTRFGNILNKQILINIINEIENNFESTLGENIFDYSEDGKPINIIYVKPSIAKQTISKGLKTLKSQNKKIEKLKRFFDSKKEYISTNKQKLSKSNKSINYAIKTLNRYVKKFNSKKITSKQQYNKEIINIKKEQKKINIKQNKFNQQQRKFKNFLNKYNQRTSSYNTLVNQYNRLQRKIERMSKGSTEVKGMAIGYKETTYETYYKDGKKYQEKTVNSIMKKIEIYGFKTLDELKATLAHEIAHLVGVGHVDENYSLMNPILQKNQINQMELTPADIDAFNEIF